MKKIIYWGFALSFVCFFVACSSPKIVENNGETSTQSEVKTEEVKKEEPTSKAPSEDELRAFLYSIEGTFGWETTADDKGLDFFQDGRLHIQGPDGEATMWQGTWKLTGDQLQIVADDANMTKTVTVKIDGEKLMLGDVTYTRYKPQ